MASVARARGDQAGAARRLREALTLSAKVGDRGNAACCLEALAVIAAGRDDLMRAARLWGAAQTQFDAVPAARHAAGLTGREVEVLALVAQG